MMMSTLHYYLMLYHVCYSWVMQMLRLWLIYIESGAKIIKVKSYFSLLFLQNQPPARKPCMSRYVG